MKKKIWLLCLILVIFAVGCTGQYGTEPAMTENEAKVMFEQLAKQSEQLARIESEMTTPVRITNVQGAPSEKKMEPKQTASDIMDVLSSVEDPEIRLIMVSKAISMEPGNLDYYVIYEKECEKLSSSLEALDATVLLITENLQYAKDSELEPMLNKAEEFNAEYNRISKEIYDEGQNELQKMLEEIVAEIRSHVLAESVDVDALFTLIETFEDFFELLDEPSDDMVSISVDIDGLVDIILEYLDVTEFAEFVSTMEAAEFAVSYMDVSDEMKDLIETIETISANDADIAVLVDHFRTSIQDTINKLETRYKNVDDAIQAKSVTTITNINKVINTHKILNLDTLSKQLNELSEAFSGISNFTPSLEAEYAEYMYLCAAYEAYLEVSKLSGNAMNMNDEDFFQYYVNISIMVDNASNTLLLRPQGMKNYGTVLDNIFTSIKTKQRKLYERYELLALRKIDKLIKDYEAAGGKGSALSKASALIGTLEINDSTEKRNADIRNTSMKLYKESFSNFQYEMGKQLAGIKYVVDQAKKADRLETLFKYGFFDIPYDELIPELKVIYDSFDVQKAISDSSKPFHDLLWRYPVIYHEVMDY